MGKVCFRIGDGLNVVPVDRFFNDFYRPGLLASIVADKRLMPKISIGHALPPRVKISTSELASTQNRRVSIQVTATDQGGGISGLRLFHNGARLKVESNEKSDKDGVTQEVFVDLVTGENQLKATAFCLDGSWEAEPVELVLRYDKPLQRANLFVVAVGVSDYLHDPLDLSYADHDAEGLADLFRSRGKAFYNSVDVQLLTNVEATSANLEVAMEHVKDVAAPSDVVIVLLAGHGKMVDGKYYFLPHDVERPVSVNFDEAVRKRGVPHDQIYNFITRVKALKRVLILDTCYSGGATLIGTAEIEADKDAESSALEGAIRRQARASGIFTIAAAAADSKAKEVKQLGHGILSYTLLAAFGSVEGGPLQGQPMTTNNPEGIAEVNDWISYADGRVPLLMERYYFRRQGIHSYSKGNSFPFLPISK